MGIGQGFEIYVNGVDLAKAFKDVSFNFETDMQDATVLNNTGARSYEAGLKTATFSFSGVFASDTVNTDEIDDVMRAAYNSGAVVQVTCSDGATVAQDGNARMLYDGKITSWQYPVDIGGLLMVEGEIQGDAGSTGIWLLKDNDATSGVTGSSTDEGGSSTSGGIFQAHLYEESDSAATDMDIRLQHSANDSTWADLSGLLQVGAAKGAVVYEVPVGTTINQYVRVTIQATTGKGYVVAAWNRY